MKELDQYISDMVDPWTESDYDQVGLVIDGYYQYRWESILKTIGSSECEQNLRLYGDEVFNDLTEEGLRNFLRDCFDNITEHYGLWTIQYYIANSKVINMNSDFIDVLKFFELGSRTNLLIEILQIKDTILINNEQKLNIFLLAEYEKIRAKFVKAKKTPRLIKEFFDTTSVADGINTIKMIVKRYNIQIIKVNQEVRNDHNQTRIVKS